MKPFAHRSALRTDICRIRARLILVAALATGLATTSLLGGCNKAQAGLLLGAGAGALAGQAIGQDTEGTVIGTAVGAGVGYVIGNEADKADRQRQSYYDPNLDY